MQRNRALRDVAFVLLRDILRRQGNRQRNEAANEKCYVIDQVTLCLAKAIEADRDFGHQLALRLHERQETLVKRAMADVLTRLFRRLTWDALPLLDLMSMR